MPEVGGQHRDVWVLGGIPDEVEEDLEEEGAEGERDGGCRQAVLSVRLYCLGVGVVFVAGDRVVIFEDEDTGSVLSRSQQRDN